MRLGRDDHLYAALWGLWSVRFLRGELTPALSAADAVRAMAERSRNPLLLVTGRHTVAYTRLFRADFPEALRMADAGLEHFDFDQEKAIATEFQLSSTVCLRQSRAQALWMLGRVAEADDEAERMLQLARELGHPHSLASALAFTLHGGGVRHAYSGELVRLRGIAEELRELSQVEGFPLWWPVAEMYLGLISHELGEPGARKRITEGFELFVQTKTRVTSVMMKVLVAERLCAEDDDLDEAARSWTAPKTRSSSGRGRSTHRRSRGCGADRWPVKDEPALAESLYRRALRAAGAQHAHSLALRAALDLHELLAAHGREAEGRAHLAEVFHDDVGWTGAQPEQARARAILALPLIETGASNDW